MIGGAGSAMLLDNEGGVEHQDGYGNVEIDDWSGNRTAEEGICNGSWVRQECRARIFLVWGKATSCAKRSRIGE